MSFAGIHSRFKSLTDIHGFGETLMMILIDLSAGVDAYAGASDNADAGALAIETQSARASADSDELE